MKHGVLLCQFKYKSGIQYSIIKQYHNNKMGNLSQICESGQAKENLQFNLQLESLILQNRRQIHQLPPIPTPHSTKICQLTKSLTISDLCSDSIIWYVTKPYQFYYFNQPAQKQSIPSGFCSIFIFDSSNSFEAFYRGQISQKKLKQIKGSLYYFANGDHFIGDKTKSEFGVYSDQICSYKYEGDWMNGKPHGLGKEICKGHSYEGYFLNGVKHGQGKIVFQNGSYCQGNFVNNDIHGQAKFIDKRHGYQYEGLFERGEKCGGGKEKTNQYIYEGEFKGNKKEGKGKMSYLKENKQYDGYFQQNKPHGYGRIKYGEDEVIEGVWRNGKLISIYKCKQ